MLAWLAVFTGVARAQPTPGSNAPGADTNASGSDTNAPGATTMSMPDSYDDDADVDDDDDTEPVTTGALRLGVYEDSDNTQVLRSLANVASNWESWTLNASAGVDVVSSASVDVRSSPLSKVDVVTSASGRTSTSGGEMTDKRLQVTGGAGWKGEGGRKLNLSAAAAMEADYASAGGGVNGSFDLWDRQITLLGGVNFTHNWIHSVLDRTLAETMYNVGWSAGLAFVATPNDALRLRYDGSHSEGYQSSPYRNVRFGDWTTMTNSDNQIIFQNTIGSADGLPELVPNDRISHAGVFEWLHSLADGVGVHSSIRLGEDSWGVRSATGGLELRVARETWRMLLGYRAYLQSRADFYQGKYTMAPSAYSYYTSDKELGDEVGHVVNLDLSTVLRGRQTLNGNRLLFDARATVMHYSYADFPLLRSRDAAFLELGLTWEM